MKSRKLIAFTFFKLTAVIFFFTYYTDYSLFWSYKHFSVFFVLFLYFAEKKSSLCYTPTRPPVFPERVYVFVFCNCSIFFKAVSPCCWSRQKVRSSTFCSSSTFCHLSSTTNELCRLHSLGLGIGVRLNELVHLRDKPGKRELKLISVLQVRKWVARWGGRYNSLRFSKFVSKPLCPHSFTVIISFYFCSIQFVIAYVWKSLFGKDSKCELQVGNLDGPM